VGDGALVEAVLQRFESIGSGCLIGYEIDRPTFDRASARFACTPVELFNRDFLASEELRSEFDAIVANPPFTRNHALSPEERATLRRQFGDQFEVTGAPGIWVYFVYAAIPLLRRGGRLAFLVPGAAAFADYAQPLMNALRDKFACVELVRVLGDIAWDGEAQERAVLVLASGYLEGSATALDLSDLEPTATGEFLKVPRARAPLIVGHTPLGELAKIEIGVVTGANRFFLLTAQEAISLALEEADLTLVAARARHLQGLTLRTADLRRLAASGEKALLLTPRGLEVRGTAIRKYLAGIPRDVRQGTKWFKKRRPWWKVQLGNTPHALFTYMNYFGPRITLVDQPITATNTLHRLTFHDPDPGKLRAIAVSTLTSYTQVHAEALGRVYGGGVLKFELHEARRLPLLIPDTPLGNAVFGRIDTALRSGAVSKARELADEAILPHFFGRLWRTTQAELNRQLTEFRKARGVKLRVS
jgi:hypothetical protein